MSIPDRKVRDYEVRILCELRDRNCSGPPYTSAYNRAGGVETRTGVRQRRKPRQLIPTPFVYSDVAGTCKDTTRVPCKSHNSSSLYRSGTMTYCHGGSSGKHFDFNSEKDVGGVRLRALAKASAKYGQFGETLATLPQTSRMISSRGKDLALIATSLKRGDWKRLSRLIKGDVPDRVKRLKPSRRLADGWLELEFGWKPLLGDIYSAVEAYKNRLDSGSMSTQYASSNGGFGGHYDERIPSKGANASAKVYGIVKSSSVVSLNNLGLLNPALIAWQLLPFSFVVDWFIPISSILAALTYRAGLSDVYLLTVTEKGRIRRHTVACCGSYTSSANRTVTRSVVRNPIPLELKWNPRGFGVWHIATSTALLRQSFR